MAFHEDITRLRSLTGEKWTHYPHDVIPAWVADMDFPPAPEVVDAVQELAKRGDFGYNSHATDKIPHVFARRQHDRFGWDVDVDKVKLFCDVVQVIELALWLYTNPGDGVVLLTPIYPPFYNAVKRSKCRVVDVALEGPAWEIDADRLEAAIDKGTRVILLCNPHNPTGRVFSKAELETVADVAQRHDLLVISDEIWGDLVYSSARHTPFASLSQDAADRSVVVTAASKAFNIAGLRCATAFIGHEGVRAAIEDLPPHLVGAVGSPGAEATLVAWTQGDAWLEGALARLQANRDRIAARLKSELPGVGFSLPEATYLAWLDFSSLDLGENPAHALRKKGRVALSTGQDFGLAGGSFARLNFATTQEILEEILDRIIEAAS